MKIKDTIHKRVKINTSVPGKFELNEGVFFGEHFLIIKPLGKGTCGEVYEVEHITLKKRFALKIFFRKFSFAPSFHNKFYQLTKNLVRLNHPNIVKIHDYGDTAGRYWYSMDLEQMEQRKIKTLAEFAKERGGTIDQSLLAKILYYILDGLAYLHAKGISHGNIKCENIFFSQSLDSSKKIIVKIADYGIVNFFDIEGAQAYHQLTQATGQEKEQIEQQLSDILRNTEEKEEDNDYVVRRQNDLYDLGVMIFGLLTNEPIGTKHFRHGREKIVPEWEEFLRQAMAEDPTERYYFAEEMMMDLVHLRQAIAEREARDEKRSEVYVRKFWIGLYSAVFIVGIMLIIGAVGLVNTNDDGEFKTPPLSSATIQTQDEEAIPGLALGTFGYKGYYDQATRYLLDGNYQKAIVDYTKALDLNPQHIDSYYNRGNVYVYMKDYEKAVTDYTKALEISPDDPNLYYNRGTAFMYQESYGKAIADYTKALTYNVQDAKTYYNRGTAFMYSGNYDKAIADYTKALELEPDNYRTYYNRGNAYNAQGDYDKAIVDYTHSLMRKPNEAKTYYNRGNAYESKEEGDKAIADYTQAIRLDPTHAKAYYNRALVYRKKNEQEKAEADFRQARALDPSYVTIKDDF